MKTAEEWIKTITKLIHDSASEQDREAIVKIAVPQIQLDAFKAGERFAAGIALKVTNVEHEGFAHGGKAASDAILTDAYNRQTLPVDNSGE